MMAREKVQIKKIDNATARRVTFSKRRRGLFKKAEELSVLCDADVAVILFSSNDKLFQYSSSSSMDEVIERRSLHSKNLEKLNQPSLELQLVEDTNYANLSKEVAERTLQLRQLRGEELQGLSIEELHQLEKSLEAGLSRVVAKKISNAWKLTGGYSGDDGDSSESTNISNSTGPPQDYESSGCLTLADESS
uniref:MADS-box domain-containing protein n=1 Tax=Lactuca sativa TaxID=4236 RepID=A0A9R1W786_LACSA|nr:hypothetical protein LSAT_V11C200075520 [Lactuca sativa]